MTNSRFRAKLVIVKQDGETKTPLSGAGFRLFNASGEIVGEGCTDENGQITFENLKKGSYTYQECEAPPGYALDDTVYPLDITEHGKTITVTVDNTAIKPERDGSITVTKKSTDGSILTGAEYLLEYSTDNGASWQPVFTRTGDSIEAGGCTSSVLNNGRLTVNSAGTATFSGLKADRSIIYRLTETKAPDGCTLLAEPLYTGTFPVKVDKSFSSDDCEVIDGENYCYNGASDNEFSTDLLYGFKSGTQTSKFLEAIGLSENDRYAAADKEVDGAVVFYFHSDTLVDALKNSLTNNATSVKNALETYVRENGGTAMPETDGYGHSAVSDLPLGLYLFVETRVPEMVTETTAPFLISLPMTSTADNASWLYNVTLYPKNLTGIPTLEKTVREAKTSSGKNNGSADITDGFAHTATASVGDVLEYQIVSTLPSITSAASYLTDYSFIDTAEKGIPYLQNGVTIEFFKDAACTDKIATWTESDGKFNVSYTTTESGGYIMSIVMTEPGLSEINTSKAVYADASMVNSGYSDCTLRITYSAQLDKSANYGDKGNTNDVVLTWKRTNSSYYDTLVDDCHVYVFGLDLTKKFSDGKGDLSKVEFCLQNDADDYYVVAKYDETAKAYYVTGSTDDKAKATRFTPRSDGRLLIYGIEDDAYTITELKTDGAYTLLKNGIGLVISVGESSTVCDVYSSDVLGLIQNDPRYADVEEGLFHNMPQKHLEHKLLTASAKVDNKQVTLGSDNGSANAFVHLTVVNTKGFDLPKTGGYGNWMFPAIGLSLVAVAVVVIYFAFRDKKKETNK